MSERSRWEEGVQITDEDAAGMAGPLADLMGHPGWQVYLELLKTARVTARELVFQQGKEHFDEWSGYVAGLQQAEALPRAIVQQAAGRAEREAAAAKPRRRLGNPFAGDSSDVEGV